MKTYEKKRLGVITVDSGTIMIADPCYWVGKTGNWKTFSEDLSNAKSSNIDHESGAKGKAVVLHSGFGDGAFEVFGLYDNDEIIGFQTLFIAEEEY